MKGIGLSIVAWLVVAQPVAAQVVINEVQPNPASGPEWIELYQVGQQAVDLTGWWLEEQLAQPSTIAQLPSATLQPGELLVIDLSSAKLNNTADGVTLKNSEGNVVDSMSYTFSELDRSWARVPNGNGSWYVQLPTKNALNVDVLPSPSPSPLPSPSPSPVSSPVVSPSPSPAPTFMTIELSEIMACPASGDTEWIEVYNPHSEPVTVAAWYVKDSSGTSKSVSTTIAPSSLGIISWTGSLLNNTGDSVTILNAQSQVVASASFPSCHTGWSFINQAGQWVLTNTPTKGVANQSSTPSPSPSPAELAENSFGEGTSPPITSTATQPTTSVLPPTTPLVRPLTASISAWHLTVQPHHPLSSPSASISVEKPTFSKWGIINVILGGILWVLAGSYFIHENYNHVI